MSFIEVKLADWDCNKVRIGVAEKDKNSSPTVLYDGQLSILTIISNDAKESYVVDSFKGLQRKMKYDGKTKKFTDTWEGEWNISFTICRKVAEISGLKKKIIEIYEDIEKKVTAAFGVKPGGVINYSWIKERNEFGIEKKVRVNPEKGAYLNVKVGYTAPETAEKFEDPKTGNMVPVFAARVPKPKFYDVDRAKADMLIQKPDPDCFVSMKCVPKILISLFRTPDDKVYITRKLMSLYYSPVNMKGDGIDEEIADMLHSNAELNSQEQP